MSNLKRLNKLYISLLVTIIAIILGSSIVNAVDFSGFSDGNNPLEASKEFYCIEHQAWFSKGTWEPTSTWTITSDNVSHPNRILANILYNGIKTGQGGYNFKGEYQWAIWKWFYENGRVSTIPVSSLTTINIRLPKFLIDSTQPAILTSFPTYSFVTSPQ